jgi:peroxidase
MSNNMDVLRFPRTSRAWLTEPVSVLAKAIKPRSSRCQFIPLLMAGVSSCAALSASASDLPGSGIPQVSLLKEYRPIGGVGNNLRNPRLNAVPGAPEMALTPLNFAAHARKNQPVSGPNARYLSNQISGGSGDGGQDSQSTDPTASAWVYVFGQFLDHDIDLEATPVTNPPINIDVAPESMQYFQNGAPNPFYQQEGSIAMNRCTRSLVTNTIINTTAGYLDLSQLYGSDTGTAASLRKADGTLLI